MIPTQILLVFLFFTIAYIILFFQSKSAGETSSLRVIKLIFISGVALITTLLLLSDQRQPLSELTVVEVVIVASCTSLIIGVLILIQAKKNSKRRSSH